jgi:hypothetical protein
MNRRRRTLRPHLHAADFRRPACDRSNKDSILFKCRHLKFEVNFLKILQVFAASFTQFFFKTTLAD